MITSFGSRQAVRATAHLSCRSGEGPSMAAVPLPDPPCGVRWCDVLYCTVLCTLPHFTLHLHHSTAQGTLPLPVPDDIGNYLGLRFQKTPHTKKLKGGYE